MVASLIDYHKPARGTAIKVLRTYFSNFDYHRWFVYRHAMRLRRKVYWFSATQVFDG